MTNTSPSIQHATSTHLTSENDDPRQARSELLKLVQQFNILLDNLGSAAFKNIGSDEGDVLALAMGGMLPQNLQPSTATMPTGTLLDFYRRTPPAGWLESKGQSIDNQNSDYRDLFLLLFSLATEGEASLTYLFASEADQQAATEQNAESAWNSGISINLPDFRGRTRIGTGQGNNLTARPFGNLLGREKTTLHKNHLPNVQLTIKSPEYSRSTRTQNNQYLELRSASYGNYSDSSVKIDNRTEPMGIGTPHDNIQPSLAILTCIKY